MMYFLLTLFFVSLLGITFMIGRKLILLQSGQITHGNDISSETPYLEELKVITIKNIKKHGFIGLVATIRFYVRSTNFLKNKYQEVKKRVRNFSDGRLNNNEEKKEVSKFLKMISEYKHKIREIKHKIKEEENNL